MAKKIKLNDLKRMIIKLLNEEDNGQNNVLNKQKDYYNLALKVLEQNPNFFTGKLTSEEKEQAIRVAISIMNTRDGGSQGGGFVQAVIKNDLFQAIGRADSTSLKSLRYFMNILHYQHLEDPGSNFIRENDDATDDQDNSFETGFNRSIERDVRRTSVIEDQRENLEYFLSFTNDDVYEKWMNGEIDDEWAKEIIRDIDGEEYDPNIDYKFWST